MKALSVKQPWASLIASGLKTIEVRSHRTHYRGPLLICASKSRKIDGLPTGVAVAVVQLVDCVPYSDAQHRDAACLDYLDCVDVRDGSHAWVLSEAVEIKPFPVKGRLGFFNVTLPHR